MAEYGEENQPYIQSQYGASPVIKKILNGFRMEIDPAGDIDLFQKNVMNVNSAQGVGLDIWGNIVGVERTIRLDDGTTVTLDDENFRNYIKFKAYANISDASLATLNRMGQVLYNDDTLLAVNVLTPTTNGEGAYYNATPMRIRFTWRGNDVDDVRRALFEKGIVNCLAAGVGYTVGVITKDPLFGFKGSGLQPFNNGAFGVVYTLGQGDL